MVYAFIFVKNNGHYTLSREFYGSMSDLIRECDYIHKLCEKEVVYKLIHNTIL